METAAQSATRAASRLQQNHLAHMRQLARRVLTVAFCYLFALSGLVAAAVAPPPVSALGWTIFCDGHDDGSAPTPIERKSTHHHCNLCLGTPAAVALSPSIPLLALPRQSTEAAADHPLPIVVNPRCAGWRSSWSSRSPPTITI
jgi:hypothetical protein